MLYDLDITAIASRNVPRWFRHVRNLAFVRVLARGLAVIHEEFLAWRQDTIIAQYRFNGLIHSLEWALNDRFDPVERRIYITVVEQVPSYHHVEDGGAAVVHALPEGMLSGYYHLDTDGEGGAEQYLYEFLVHVPASITFAPPGMFQLLDLYRYAGRRPAIRRFNELTDGQVQLILHPMHNPPANWLVPSLPDFNLETE